MISRSNRFYFIIVVKLNKRGGYPKTSFLIMRLNQYRGNVSLTVGGIDVDCDFGNIQVDKRILSKFHHTDHERLLSRVSMFSYTSQDSLRRLINDNDCYQDLDQLCLSWVEELYKWDTSISKLPNASDWNWSRIHPCFCIRHSARLSNHQAGTNNRYTR